MSPLREWKDNAYRAAKRALRALERAAMQERRARLAEHHLRDMDQRLGQLLADRAPRYFPMDEDEERKEPLIH